MTEFTEILERIDISRIAAFFLYGSEPMSVITDSYEERINTSFRKIFNRLEEIFPSANKNNEDLQDAISELVVTHSDVYLQIGVLIGFQLYKVLDQSYHDPKSSGIDKILKDYITTIAKPQKEGPEESMENGQEEGSLLEHFFEERKFNSLEKALETNTDYQNALKACSEELNSLKQCSLDSEQKKAVDKALSAANAVGSEYGTAAYRLGFHDARKLMLELLK